MFKAIKYTAIFLYHFLFIDQSTGHQSNTKFFANIGYFLWCWLFPYAVMHGSQANMDLWMVFGAVVIGNRTLNVLMQQKAGVPATGDGSWKNVLGDIPPGQAQTTTVAVKVVVPATDDLVDQ